MASFLDMLRKLGIFRSGSTSGVYHNAKERPIELQDQGVFDANKDLVNHDSSESTDEKTQ